METFWMIWNPQGHAPTVKHTTPESARKEAERLALANEDTKFYILQAVACCERIKPVSWQSVSQNEIDIPF